MNIALKASILGLAALAAGATAATGHTVWLEPAAGQPGDYRVLFNGHKGVVEKADPAKLKTAEAFDTRGRKLAVTRVNAPDGLHLRVAGHPSMLTAFLDNGFHTTTPEGKSVETTMDKVPGAVNASHNPKYTKLIVQWTPAVTRPVGQPMELIPVSAAAPRAGQPMRVQVRIDGKPAAGVTLGNGEDTANVVSDAQGFASYTPTAGYNRLWAGQRSAVTGNRQFTELSREYRLSFDAK